MRGKAKGYAETEKQGLRVIRTEKSNIYYKNDIKSRALRFTERMKRAKKYEPERIMKL